MPKKQEKIYRRQRRARAKTLGTKEKPRLSIFRSAKHIYCQIINDENAKTLASASDWELGKNKKTKKTVLAFEVGKIIAKKAIEKKVDKVVFDRGSYKYHGRVKAAADGAREGGLKF